MSTSASALASSLGGGKLSELKNRILFVIGALLVFRLGSFIPVPGINPEALSVLFDQQRDSILGMFNMFSGGALERLSVFALGIMPYISASIIIQHYLLSRIQTDETNNEMIVNHQYSYIYIYMNVI